MAKKKAQQPNAIARIRAAQSKKVPNKAHAGPTIRPDERGLMPVVPGKSRPVNYDYNLWPSNRWPTRFKKP